MSTNLLLACALLYVVDGDTFKADCDGHLMTLRLADIDAPERYCPVEWVESRAALVQALTGHPLYVHVLYEDRYGRAVSQVSADGQSVEDTMLRRGYAQPWRFDADRQMLEPKPKGC